MRRRFGRQDCRTAFEALSAPGSAHRHPMNRTRVPRWYRRPAASRRAGSESRSLPEQTMGAVISSGWTAVAVGFYTRALAIDRCTVPLAHEADASRWLILSTAGCSSPAQGRRLARLAVKMMRRARWTCARCGQWTPNGAVGAGCRRCASIRRTSCELSQIWAPHRLW